MEQALSIDLNERREIFKKEQKLGMYNSRETALHIGATLPLLARCQGSA
jgi:hypothetical protein